MTKERWNKEIAAKCRRRLKNGVPFLRPFAMFSGNPGSGLVCALISPQKIKVNQGGSSLIKVNQGFFEHFYFLENQTYPVRARRSLTPPGMDANCLS